MIKSRNAIIILGLLGAFILGTLTANPVVDAVGGWKVAFDNLQSQINDLGFTTQSCTPGRSMIGINSDGTMICSTFLDLAVSNNFDDDISILLNDGAGDLSTRTDFPVGDSPRRIAVGDFNGDTKLDLAVANTFDDDVSILLGDGTGDFSTRTDFPVGDKPEGIAVGEFRLKT